MTKLEDWFDEKDYGIGLALLGAHSKNRVLTQNLTRKKNPKKLEYELRKIAEHQGIDLTEEVEDLTPKEGDVITDEATGITYKFTNGEFVEYKEKDESGNSDKLKELDESAGEIVSDKLGELASDAEDIVSDKLAEFESQVQEIMSGKLEIVRNGRKVKFEELSPEMQARWNQNRDGYKEIRALHEKLKLMENATPEDRQPLTQRMCELDDQIRDNWESIDAYVPRPNNNEPVVAIDHKRIQANRKYISSNLKKLPEVQDPVKSAKIVSELQARFDELKTAGESVAQETIDELTKAGIKC